MNRVEALPSADLKIIARDLPELLIREDNQDIAKEFPMSIEQYTGEFAVVLNNLEARVRSCEPGVRERFVTFAGERAVGISALQLSQNPPEGIDPRWPNVSLFICRPYRKLGLGALTVNAHLEAARQRFNGYAWTQVEKNNSDSENMVKNAGFLLLYETETHTIFTHTADR